MKRRPVKHLRQERFSLARYIIELLAYHWAMEREPLSLSALRFYYEDITQIPVERRRAILQYVSNILNALSRKKLIHLVKRRYVINVPRILYLYHVNLPKDKEPGQKDKRRALMMASGGIVQHLGEATFPREEALCLAEEVVKRYYEVEDSLYPDFLQALESFIDNAVKLYTELNKPEISKHFEDKVVSLLNRYMLGLIAMREELVDEFLEEFRALLVDSVGDEELVNRVLESWNLLNDEVELLASDRDFRVRLYAKKFVYKVINVELSSALLSRLI